MTPNQTPSHAAVEAATAINKVDVGPSHPSPDECPECRSNIRWIAEQIQSAIDAQLSRVMQENTSLRLAMDDGLLALHDKLEAERVKVVEVRKENGRLKNLSDCLADALSAQFEMGFAFDAWITINGEHKRSDEWHCGSCGEHSPKKDAIEHREECRWGKRLKALAEYKKAATTPLEDALSTPPPLEKDL